MCAPTYTLFAGKKKPPSTHAARTDAATIYPQENDPDSLYQQLTLVCK